MRFYFIMLYLFFTTSSIFSQALELETRTKTQGSISVCIIQPTIHNLIDLVEMSESQFVATMKKYGYFENDNSGGKYLHYWNTTLSNIDLMASITIRKNILQKEVRCYIPRDREFPKGAYTNLYRSLRPYYISSYTNEYGKVFDEFKYSTSDDQDRVYSKSATFIFALTMSDSQYIIEVRAINNQ